VAHRIDKSQTEEQLTLRTRCLNRQQHAFKTVVDLFQGIDEEGLKHAIDTAEGLPSLALCSNIDALSERIPVAPGKEESVEELSWELAELEVLIDIGKTDAAKGRLESVLVQADKVDFAPARAEVLLYQGQMAHRRGDYDAAEEALRQSVRHAEKGRDDLAKARALSELAFVVGHYQHRFDEGLEWGRLGEAALHRGGGDDLLQARLFTNIGLILMDQKKSDEALKILERSLAVRKRLLGDTHPHVAVSLNDIGICHSQAGRYEEALPLLQEAMQVRVAVFGESHPLVASSLGNIGNVYWRQGDVETSLEYHQRSLGIKEKHFGADHVATAKSHTAIGTLYLKLEQWPKAEASLRSALDIFNEKLKPDHADVARVLGRLGYVLFRQARYAEAAPLLEKELAILEKQRGRSHPSLVSTLRDLGEAHLALNRPAPAVPLLQRAVNLFEHEANNKDKQARAETRFSLAQARWKAWVDRPTALELARQAQEDLKALGQHNKATEIQRWLNSR
jgi:tetratricopeptide (TPR) repeat protein